MGAPDAINAASRLSLSDGVGILRYDRLLSLCPVKIQLFSGDKLIVVAYVLAKFLFHIYIVAEEDAIRSMNVECKMLLRIEVSMRMLAHRKKG